MCSHLHCGASPAGSIAGQACPACSSVQIPPTAMVHHQKTPSLRCQMCHAAVVQQMQLKTWMMRCMMRSSCSRQQRGLSRSPVERNGFCSPLFQTWKGMSTGAKLLPLLHDYAPCLFAEIRVFLSLLASGYHALREGQCRNH